jgi:hypothetical protein
MGSGDDKMIYFQNGIKTNDKTAKSVVNLIGTIINNSHEVGLIHNDTLTAHTYEKIAKSGEKSLIILHSAGNQDYYKAATYAALEGKDLSGLDVMSVGSPRSLVDLQAASDKVNVNFLGQYNDWKDPVANSLDWIAGTGSTAVVGLGVGAAVGASIASGAVFMAAYGGALLGGGTILRNLNKYHGIESYLNRNQNGVRTDIQDWAKRNRRVN